MTYLYRPIPTCVLFGLLLMSIAGYAQTYYSVCYFTDNESAFADSLKTELVRTEPSQQRVRLLLRLGGYYVYKSGEFRPDVDSARTYAQQAQQLSHQLDYLIGEVLSLNLLGTVSKEARQFGQAVAYQQQAIAFGTARRDAVRLADSYRLLSQACRGKGDVQQARRAAQAAIAISARNGHGQQAAEAYLELGNTFANEGEDLNQKIKYYQQGLQGFVKAHNSKRQADTHKDLGDLYQLQGAYALSIIELRKALALYKSIQHPRLQGVYDLLGSAHTDLGDYQQGLRYGLLAAKTAETLQDTSLQVCTIYNRLGLTYYDIQDFPKALFYYKKSLAVARQYNDASSIITLTINMAQTLTNVNQSQEAIRLMLRTAEKFPPQSVTNRIHLTSNLLRAYSATKRYGLAQRYCDQLVAISDSLGEHDGEQAFIYTILIPFYLKTKQYELARKYLLTYEQYNKTLSFPWAMQAIQLNWFRLDSAQANYVSAIKHYQQFKQLQDAKFNNTKSQQLANLEVIYETEKKEQTLKLNEQSIKVLTQEKQLQAAQIRKERLIRNEIIATTVLLLLLLGVIYNRYRLKQRSNQLLEAKQQEINQHNRRLQQVLGEKDSLLAEKENLLTYKDSILLEKDGLLQEKQWLLREVHHRVKNNLQVVVSLLSSQAAYLLDEKALLAIQESQNRIHAISLIHQKLYLSENIALVDMSAYIREVADYLIDSFQVGDRVQLQLRVDSIELDGAIAVPLGLIINEAVTNSLKYAFPGGRKGQVSIRLQAVGEQSCLLTIADDGIGLEHAVDLAHTRSLGMVLMKGLTKQLDGTLTIDNTDGLTVSVLFNKASKKVNLEKSAR